jgi:hypothetical protein
MRIGVSLLALLMIGAVAVGPTAAEDARGDSSGAKSDGNSSGSSSSQTSASPQAATGATAGAGQDTQAAGKDSGGGDKGDKGSSNKSAKGDKGSNDQSDKGKGIGNADDNGRAPKPDKSAARGKESAPSIDTTITVRQGKETSKNAKKQLLKDKDSNTKAATDKHAKDNKPSADTRADKEQRNAVGAKITKDKPAQQDQPRNATGQLVTLPANPGGNAKAAAAPAGRPASSPNPAAAEDRSQAVGATPPNPSVVAGTGLVKPATRTGMITGAPKPIAGVVSGNTVHLKHP